MITEQQIKNKLDNMLKEYHKDKIFTSESKRLHINTMNTYREVLEIDYITWAKMLEKPQIDRRLVLQKIQKAK